MLVGIHYLYNGPFEKEANNAILFCQFAQSFQGILFLLQRPFLPGLHLGLAIGYSDHGPGNGNLSGECVASH